MQKNDQFSSKRLIFKLFPKKMYLNIIKHAFDEHFSKKDLLKIIKVFIYLLVLFK